MGATPCLYALNASVGTWLSTGLMLDRNAGVAYAAVGLRLRRDSVCLRSQRGNETVTRVYQTYAPLVNHNELVVREINQDRAEPILSSNGRTMVLLKKYASLEFQAQLHHIPSLLLHHEPTINNR